MPAELGGSGGILRPPENRALAAGRSLPCRPCETGPASPRLGVFGGRAYAGFDIAPRFLPRARRRGLGGVLRRSVRPGTPAAPALRHSRRLAGLRRSPDPPGAERRGHLPDQARGRHRRHPFRLPHRRFRGHGRTPRSQGFQRCAARGRPQADADPARGACRVSPALPAGPRHEHGRGERRADPGAAARRLRPCPDQRCRAASGPRVPCTCGRSAPRS